MKKQFQFLFLIIALSISTGTFANLPTGEWQTHMSYLEGQRLAISDTKVYVVASGSLFSYGLNDNALETYTKVNNLSDVYINDIAFCDDTETLVICYANGNIDLMDKDDIINIPDLYIKTIYGSKAINKVDVYEKTAYISTAFGLLKLNIEKAEISETYTLTDGDVNGVNGAAVLDNEIYAATDNGIYKADLSNNNLQNFTAWTRVTSIDNPTMPVKGIITFNNHIVAAQYNSSDSKYYIKQQLSDTEWNTLMESTLFNSLGSNNGLLMIPNGSNIKIFDSSFNELSKVSSYNFGTTNYSTQNTISANAVLPIDANTFYVADSYQGLVYYQKSANTLSFMPKGPATNMIWDIDITENIVRTVHGGYSQDYNNTWISGAYSSYIDNQWSYYNNKNAGINYLDFVGIITDPLDVDHFFISSFGYGILEYQDNELVIRYTENNSTLENAIPGSPRYVRTIGMAFDGDNNLWVTTNSVSSQLHVLTSDDEWFAFESTLPKENLRYSKLLITEDDVKWMVSPYFGDGILVYDDKGTYDDASDDEDNYFSINALNSNSSSEFVSDNVEDIALDNNGAIWVGSDNGVAIYSSPENIFNTSSPQATRIQIPRNDGTDLVDYLLNNTTVNSIAVDGGNRKWLATATTGVMLVSSDGLDVIHHFTKENSKLLDNNVRQVKVNQETGEVFFATEAGLISYQADATSGEDDFSNLKVYPNPVREDFYGDITITGLVDNTSIKITDVSGNLVKETTSNGGTAVWDATNFYGQRVGTGVYLIFCSDDAGERSGMTKVLVIN